MRSNNHSDTVPEILRRPIEKLESIEPLHPEDMGHTTDHETVERMQPLVRPLTHFARTEKKTEDTQAHLRTIHPRSQTHQITLPLWESHELPHGQIIDDELVALGSGPAEDADGSIPVLYPVLGLLGTHSEAFDRALSIATVGTAATHEYTTMNGYKQLKKRCHSLGATAFAETIGKIIPQEASHYGLYRTWLSHELSHANRWERWLGKKMISMSWQPVGAKKKEYRADFGSVALEIFGDTGVDNQAAKIQSTADKLLGEGEGLLPGFAVTSIRRCVEQYKQQQEVRPLIQ